MKRILITGGAGHIGGALALRLSGVDNYQVVVLDNLQTSSKEKIPVGGVNSIEFVKADVNEWDEISAVMTARPFDFVFHYAATVGVNRTIAQPMSVMRDIDGISHVLKLANLTGVSRVFYSSSSEVYGEPVESPQNEMTTPLNSRLPYAIVKNVGEAFVRSYHQEHSLDYTIFRFFNTYGPRQSEDFVISKFLKAAIRGLPLTIYGDGMQTRTFCWIDDNVETAVKCLESGHALNTVLNVGNDNEMTILDVAKAVLQTANSRSEIQFLPPLAEGDMTRRLPAIGRMKKILGRPLMGFDEGMSRLISAWEPTMESHG